MIDKRSSAVAVRCLAGSVALLCLLAAPSPQGATAAVLSNGPVIIAGYTDKLEKKMVIPALGWRWELGAGDTLSGWAERAQTRLSFVIEPSVGGIFGEKTSVETQVVPMLRLEPLGMQDSDWMPYFE